MPAEGPTYFAFDSLEARQNWERDLHFEVLRNTAVFNPEYNLVGDKPTFMVQRLREVFKQGGTQATMTLLRQLRGAPTQGNQTLRDREEGIDTSTHKFQINLTRHAVRVEGEIVENRVTWDVAENGKVLLGEFWAKVLEAGALMHLTGFTINANRTYEHYLDGTSTSTFTGNNAPTAADAVHYRRPNGNTTDEGVGGDPSAVITPKFVNTLVALAKQLPLPIRQIRWGKANVYALFLHTNHVTHLKETYSDWFAIMQAAIQGGQIAGNPIFTGALGMWNGVVFIETPYLPPGIHSTLSTPVSNCRRFAFCGRQALGLGLGKRYPNENQFKLVEEKWDYGDKVGFGGKLIYGLTKPRYTLSEDATTHDFGVITGCAYAEEVLSTL